MCIQNIDIAKVLTAPLGRSANSTIAKVLTEPLYKNCTELRIRLIRTKS